MAYVRVDGMNWTWDSKTNRHERNTQENHTNETIHRINHKSTHRVAGVTVVRCLLEALFYPSAEIIGCVLYGKYAHVSGVCGFSER